MGVIQEGSCVKRLLKSLWANVLFCVPRIVTSEVVFELADGGEWLPVCDVKYIQPGQYCQKVGRVRSIQWLWFGIDFQQECPLRDFNGGGRG